MTGHSAGPSAAQVRESRKERDHQPERGIDRLMTWGYSGGGPPVLACAALLPDTKTDKTRRRE
jgi:hypothetical protein